MENTLPLTDVSGEPEISKIDSATVQKKVTTSWKVVAGKLYPYRPMNKPKP